MPKQNTKHYMKKWFILSLFMFVSDLLFSQNPVDTIVALQNIEIRGSRFGGISGGEIKRLDVEGNLTGVSVSAADAFRQIPSLNTDIEGQLTFRGSTKVNVLLRDVPYGLLEEYSGDVFIQLPSFFFNRMEMYSYPPVQWLADGDAGVLNLSSSPTRYDSPIQVHLGAGLEDRYNAGIGIHLSPGKFYLSGRYNYRQEYRKRSFRKTTTHSTGSTEMNNNASARPGVHLADLELGYNLSDKDVISLYGLYHLMDYSRYGGINNTRRNPAGEIINKMLRNRYNDQKQEAYAGEIRWLHSFENPNDHIAILFNFNNFTYDEDNDYKNENPATGVIIAEDNMFLQQDKKNYYFTALSVKNFPNNLQLRSGYIGRHTKENYSTESNNLNEGVWIYNPDKSDLYEFKRTIHVLYASLIKDWNKFSVEAGLQGELSNRKIRNEKYNRFNLYPRISLSYKTNETDRLSLHYQQRVIRPAGKDLNNFIDNSDATHISQGNPDLKDERIHSLELSYSMNMSKFRLTPAVYYRNKDNRIMEVINQVEELTIWKKENLGNSQLIGSELYASWNPYHFLSAVFAGNIFRDEIDGRNIGYDEKKTMVCWDIKAALNFHLTSQTELQIDGFYLSDQLTPQGEIGRRYTVNAGISHYLMKRKMRLNFSINNIFDTLEEVTTIHTENMHMKQVRNRDARVSWLSLSYHL